MGSFKAARWIASGAAVALATGLVACSGGDEGGSGADSGFQGTLRAVGTLPLESHGTAGLEMLKELIEADPAFEGVTVDIFPAGQLYEDGEIPDAIPDGGADIAMASTAYWTGRVPAAAALELPLVYETNEHVFEVREEITPMLDEEFQESSNTKLLGWFNWGDAATILTREAHSMEDLQGVQIRASGEYNAAFWSSAGVNTVTMNPGDVYEAMQRGTIEGAVTAWPSIVDRSFYEVADYTFDPASPLIYYSYGMFMNLDRFDELSSDQQDALDAIITEIREWSLEQVDSEVQRGRDFIEQSDEITNIEISREATEAMRDATYDAVTGRFLENGGPNAQPILDIIEETRANYTD